MIAPWMDKACARAEATFAKNGVKLTLGGEPTYVPVHPEGEPVSLGFASRASLGMSRGRRFFARFDWPLFGTIAVLVAVGLANLYSATSRTPHSVKFDNQVLWTVVGVGCYLVFTECGVREVAL